MDFAGLHDGTIALTQTYNPRNAPTGTIYISAQDRGYIGTDLSDDHPISLEYTSSVAAAKGQLIDPSTLPKHLPLDKQGMLQCTTCHNPHDDRYGNFLRMSNARSAMCRTCHVVDGWIASAHAACLSMALAAGLHVKNIETAPDDLISRWTARLEPQWPSRILFDEESADGS